jgi:hypothetical protein
MSFAEGATASSLIQENSLRYAGWRVVFACFVMAVFLFGIGLYGQGVYLVELKRLNDWSTVLISGASTLSFLLSNILSLFTSDLVARLGLRAVQRSLHELDRLQCSDAADSEAISGVGDILGTIEAQNVGRE